MTRQARARRNEAVRRGLAAPVSSLAEAVRIITSQLEDEFHARETSARRRAEIYERFVLLRAVLAETEAEAGWLDEIGTLLLGSPLCRDIGKHRPN